MTCVARCLSQNLNEATSILHGVNIWQFNATGYNKIRKGQRLEKDKTTPEDLHSWNSSWK